MTLTPDQLAEVVLTALAAQPNLQVFDGEPDSGIPSRGFGAPKTSVAMDADGRAHVHAAAYFGVGRPDDQRPCGGFGGTDDTFQVTCVGGDRKRALLAASKVKAALHGLQVDDGKSRILLDDFDPGPVRVDRDPSPSRSYLPLTFRVPL